MQCQKFSLNYLISDEMCTREKGIDELRRGLSCYTFAYKMKIHPEAAPRFRGY
jgi:hypothetical protein